LVRPARSESQAFIDQSSPLRGASNLSEVKKLACCHWPCASRFTTASLGGSSAITLVARGFEFG
jgi:hypothetical protein